MGAQEANREPSPRKESLEEGMDLDKKDESQDTELEDGRGSDIAAPFHLFIYLFIYFCLFPFSRAAPAAYVGSQARG